MRIKMNKRKKKANKDSQSKTFNEFNFELFINFKAIAGLRDIHQLGYLHRDIKPQNMCFGLSEAVYILLIAILRQCHTDVVAHNFFTII